MDNKDREILKKLLKHTRHAIAYAEPFPDAAAFAADDLRVEATVFNLMQMGELAKTSLSDELKTAVPAIPWKQIYGLRNRIVHGYDGVNLSMIWDTVQTDLPLLEQQLSALLEG